MTFFEQKKQAEADGMVVTSKTKKADITAFYASIVTAETKIGSGEIKLIEDKTDANVVIKEVIVEVEKKCNHFYEFANIAAVRGPKPLDKDGEVRTNADGIELKGQRSYKDRYVCKLCGEVELRDQK